MDEIMETMPQVMPVGSEQARKWTTILLHYQSGKAHLEARLKSAESWWKLRNTIEERKESEIGKDGGFAARSGWLHNVIVSKHADAMESFPEPNILPREADDKAEAQTLSSIIPYILERNHFEDTYSDAQWDKCKFGTAVYKVVWDAGAANGLGDIAVETCSLLNVFWEPNIKDIQQSRYFFHTEMMDKDLLQEQYPQLKGKLKDSGFVASEYTADDTNAKKADKATIIDVYYHKPVNGKQVLHYAKYVGSDVLFATENEPEYAERGWYDHGLYPYVFDALFPVEGSPCGYGYVDICRNPQTEIDLMRTAFLKNTMVGAIPRWVVPQNANVNTDELLDLSNPLIRYNGSLSDLSFRPVQHNGLDGSYFNVLNSTIEELRETSGNTETSTGNISSGVTAASAIAALQEASGKGSRDSTQTSYRAYSQIVEQCIELIRQFYDVPRKFRIVGQYNMQQFITYSNAGLKPQSQGEAFGMDMGYRMPVFDIKVSAQKRNIYTKVSQNELAIQFFNMGIFNPAVAEPALMMLDMMEFDGKDALMQKISAQAMMMQKLFQYMQMAMGMAQAARPDLVPLIQQDMMETQAQLGQAGLGGQQPQGMVQSDAIAGIKPKEPTIVKNARARSSTASSPDRGNAQ